MSRFRTVAEYRAMVKAMPTKEVEALAQTYNECQSLGVRDVVIKDILNEEMESRILEWESEQ